MFNYTKHCIVACFYVKNMFQTANIIKSPYTQCVALRGEATTTKPRKNGPSKRNGKC